MFICEITCSWERFQLIFEMFIQFGDVWRGRFLLQLSFARLQHVCSSKGSILASQNLHRLVTVYASSRILFEVSKFLWLGNCNGTNQSFNREELSPLQHFAHGLCSRSTAQNKERRKWKRRPGVINFKF